MIFTAWDQHRPEWAVRLIADRAPRLYGGAAMAAVVTNLDLLEWFDEDERSFCRGCGRRTAVQLPKARASFCLACGAVEVDGVRLDMDGRFDLLW